MIPQPADEVEDLGDLPHADGRRRLVHQHDLGLREPGPGDRHGLALPSGHPPDQIARPRLRLELGEQLARPLVHGPVVQDPDGPEAGRQLAAQEDIRRRRQVVAERQILVDDLDALRAGIGRLVKRHPAAEHLHRAAARRVVPGDDLHERGLAGAVVAHEPDDLAGPQGAATRRAAPGWRRSASRSRRARAVPSRGLLRAFRPDELPSGGTAPSPKSKGARRRPWTDRASDGYCAGHFPMFWGVHSSRPV